MESDGTSSAVDAISLMKEAVAEYVVNCFLAAGYDTTEVINAMDISESPGNSLFAKCFEFPPGHRIRFVTSYVH